MRREYDKLHGYEDGRLVAIADCVGGDAWNVWHCRSVGWHDSYLDTIGCTSENAARKYMHEELRCERVVKQRGTAPRPPFARPLGLFGGTVEKDADFWLSKARFCGLTA